MREGGRGGRGGREGGREEGMREGGSGGEMARWARGRETVSKRLGTGTLYQGKMGPRQ